MCEASREKVSASRLSFSFPVSAVSKELEKELMEKWLDLLSPGNKKTLLWQRETSHVPPPEPEA